MEALPTLASGGEAPAIASTAPESRTTRMGRWLVALIRAACVTALACVAVVASASLAAAELKIEKISYGPGDARLGREMVVVRNNGRQSRTMGGWTLSNEAGQRLRFPKGFTLRPRAVVRVHTGSGRNDRNDVYGQLKREVWLRSRGRALLTGPSGKNVDRCAYREGPGVVHCSSRALRPSASQLPTAHAPDRIPLTVRRRPAQSSIGVVRRARSSSGCNLVGTPRDDVIVGTPGDDTICAGDGHDVVYGLGGSDRVYGGPGNDVILGGNERQSSEQSLGRGDRLIGGKGNDQIFGEDGVDHLHGDDSFLRRAEDAGAAGSDKLFGGSGADSLEGGPGDDILHVGSAELTVTTIPYPKGQEMARGGPGNDIMLAGPGARSVFRGDAGDDIMFPFPLRTHILGNSTRGGDGNDTAILINGMTDTFAAGSSSSVPIGAGCAVNTDALLRAVDDAQQVETSCTFGSRSFRVTVSADTDGGVSVSTPLFPHLSELTVTEWSELGRKQRRVDIDTCVCDPDRSMLPPGLSLFGDYMP